MRQKELKNQLKISTSTQSELHFATKQRQQIWISGSALNHQQKIPTLRSSSFNYFFD